MHALERWPGASFYGRTQLDVYVQTNALLWELTRLPRDPYVWYGLFVWSGNGGLQHPNKGCWGGAFEDDQTMGDQISAQLLQKEKECPSG